MPSGVFPVPKYRPVPPRTKPSVVSRMRAAWHRNGTDVKAGGTSAPLPAARR